MCGSTFHKLKLFDCLIGYADMHRVKWTHSIPINGNGKTPDKYNITPEMIQPQGGKRATPKNPSDCLVNYCC